MDAEDAARRPRRKPSARGFTRAGAFLAPALRGAAGARGIAEHRLLTDWTAITGPEVAALCLPLRIEHRPRRGEQGLGGALVLAADGCAALEIAHLAPVIVERVNAAFGYRAVSRLRIDQTGARPTAAPVLAEPPASWRAAPVDPAPSPLISRIADEGLRAALARLDANIRRRAARPRRDGPRTEQEPAR